MEMSKEQGNKNDGGKLRWLLVPWEVMVDVVKILMFGADKYGDNNWQVVEPYKKRYLDAAMRHILGGIDKKTGDFVKGYVQGQVYDIETGLHNLAHAVCSLLFIIWKDKTDA